MPSDGKLSWNDANDKCRKMDAQLAIIDGNDLNDLINSTLRQLVNDDLWIGLKRCGGSWCYPNKYSASYYNWRKKEPNNSGGNENCVEMWSDGMWNDVPCSVNNSFICEKRKMH